MSDVEATKLQVEAWKMTVQVQQHFNDIEMKIRALAITVLTAVIGAAALAIRDGTTVGVGPLTIHLGAAILLTGLLVWMLFYFVDQVWYHRLLVGAVQHGQALERILSNEITGFELTTAIGKASPYQMRFLRRDVGKPIHSATKLRIFYYGVAILLIVGTLIAQVGGLSITRSNEPRGQLINSVPSRSKGDGS